MKTSSSLPLCARETRKRKWSGTKDTCPECVRDTDIASLSCRDRPERRERESESHPSHQTRQLIRDEGKEGKGREERSPQSYRRRVVVDAEQPLFDILLQILRSEVGGTKARRHEGRSPRGKATSPSIPAFDASHYGNAISRASLENYVDVMPHLLAPSPPPSYRHPYPLLLPNLLPLTRCGKGAKVIAQ